ncbi:MAG: hypothetical protein EOO69_09475 [Moraxellaceae bacterium]|nr:MAG: hypothetical protein EOO69_09475 [Moraxellaceae bacterium]
MKILTLRLGNLASIAGDHVINFEQEPLKNAGLIAITGITGAGKTTLLDAICLALFDQIPRLQKAEGKLADTSGDEVQINSTVNILRRGCAQGFAEVEFIAQDSKHYLARWEVKRARLKADGRIQPVQRALRCISDDQLISERTKECNEKITQLLGLTFSQFTRAVLLAQSEVTAFLKAKDNERADLLEYLTNSDIYSRIGMASFAATKQARETVDALEKKMGDQLPLSEDERQVLQQQLQAAQQQLIEQQQQQQQFEKQLEWYSQQQQIQQQIAQQQDLLTTAQQQFNDFQPQMELLQQLEQFEPVRASFVQTQQLEQQQAELLNIQQTSAHQATILEQQLSQHQQQYQQQLDAQNNLHQQQQSLKPQLQTAQHCEHQLASLHDQIRQQQDKLEHLSAGIAPQLAQQTSLTQQVASVQSQQSEQLAVLQQTQEFACFDAEPQAAILTIQKAAQLREMLAQQQADIVKPDIASQQQQVHDIGQQLASLTTQHGSLEQFEQQWHDTQQQLDKQHKHQAACERIGDQLKSWLSIEQHIVAMQQQQSKEQQQLIPLQTDAQHASQNTQHAEQQLKTTQQLLHEQRLFTAQSVQDLRQQLKPEHPCMVCGSTEHPFYDPQNLLNALNQQLDEQQQQAELTLQQARQQEALLQQQVTRLQTSLDQLSHRQKQALDERQAVLDKIHAISSKFYERLAQQPELEFAQQLLKDIQDKLDCSRTLLEQQCQQQQTQLKQWQQLEKQHEQSQKLLEKQQELLALEQQTIAGLTPPLLEQWEHNCKDAASQWVQHIQLRCTAHEQLKVLEKQSHQQQQQLLQLQSSVQHQQAQQAELKQQIEAQQASQQHIQQQLNAIFVQDAAPFKVASTTDWQQQLQQQLEQQQQQLNTADQHRQDSEKQYLKLQQQQQHTQQDWHKNQHALQHVQQQIVEWQQQHPELTQPVIEKLLHCDYLHKQQLQQQCQRLQQQLQQVQNTLSVYDQQWQQHLSNQPLHSLSDLQHHTLESIQTLQQLDAQYTALKLKKLQDEQQQQQAVQYQAELTKAKAEHHRWDKISSLIGDAKGATFKKLAQQFHLHMLVELANQQLAALTPRYSLRCIEDSLGLTIVDHYMNDEVRPVLSLSGGESFLVSLALALGIANMASGNTKLESLFIDEGFGTLDQSALHVVMDALDRLQSQGRKVVLISHIQDMHERIPVKIQVIPQGSGASRIEVMG